MSCRESRPSGDVLVVGGGPAGSVAALLLARAGWRVALLERSRPPRPKPCGECLSPGAVAALRRLDLLGRVLALQPAVLDGWEIRAGGTSATGDFPPGAEPGLAVARDRLDQALLGAAAEAGVQVEVGVTARGMAPLDGGGLRSVGTREADGAPGERRARVVVGADGLRSVVARSLGAPGRPPRLRKLSLTAHVRGRRPGGRRGVVALSARGTVGLAPLVADEGLWNLTCVVDSARYGRIARGGPLRLLMELAEPATGPWLEGPDVVAGPWASGPFDWPMRVTAADGVVLVGDASGYYDPLTGQGIYRALRSAELAAEAIDSALAEGRVSRAALRRYERRREASFGPGLAVQRMVETVVSRDWLRDGVVARLARRPGFLGALLGVTGDAAPVRSLVRPSALAALVLPPRGRLGPMGG